MIVAIVFNRVGHNAKPDEIDILDQVELIEKTLKELGYDTRKIMVDFKIDKLIDELSTLKPDFVFNLVESIENNGEFLYFATAIYDYLKIPYSGVKTSGMFVTTNKPLAKKFMSLANINTPEWFELTELHKLNKNKSYLVKPKLEEGSLGFDDDLVFKGADVFNFPVINTLSINHFFIEEYIEGREFNVSVLGGNKGPEVLPIPEMIFNDYPEGKPRIMGYKAKWEENSFEYDNTSRNFINETAEIELVEKIRKICIDCWNLFELSGYVRVDFRLDEYNNPFVLEVNANPCITPGSGFYVACNQAGYSFAEATARIIEDIKL